MKTAVLVLLCSLVFSDHKASEPDPKRKILIVGFSKSYFNSDSFESLAEGNRIHEDSIFKFIGGKLLKTFADRLASRFEYILIDDAMALTTELETSIYYLSPASAGGITSVKINEHDIKKVCTFYEADIIVFINSYELNWEEEPYLSYVHSFDSEMFIKSGRRIDEDKVSFMTDDAELEEQYANKLSRQVSRILKKLERTSIEDDAFVNR